MPISLYIMDEVQLPLERQQMREIGAQILKKCCDPENKVLYRNPSEIPSARQICLEVLHSKTGQKISRVKELLLEGANQVRPEICRIYSQKDVDFFFKYAWRYRNLPEDIEYLRRKGAKLFYDFCNPRDHKHYRNPAAIPSRRKLMKSLKEENIFMQLDIVKYIRAGAVIAEKESRGTIPQEDVKFFFKYAWRRKGTLPEDKNAILTKGADIFCRFCDPNDEEHFHNIAAIPSCSDLRREFNQINIWTGFGDFIKYLKEGAGENSQTVNQNDKNLFFKYAWIKNAPAEDVEKFHKKGAEIFQKYYDPSNKAYNRNSDLVPFISELQQEFEQQGIIASYTTVQKHVAEGIKIEAKRQGMNEIDVDNLYAEMRSKQISMKIRLKIEQIALSDAKFLLKNKPHLIKPMFEQCKEVGTSYSSFRTYYLHTLKRHFGEKVARNIYSTRVQYFKQETAAGDWNHEILTRLWKKAQESNLINHPDWPDLFAESRLSEGKRPDFIIPDVHHGDFFNSCLNQDLNLWYPYSGRFIPTNLYDLFDIHYESVKRIKHLIGDFTTYCDPETHSQKWEKYCSRPDTFLFIINTGYWPYGDKMVHQDPSYPRSLVVRAEMAAKFFQFQEDYRRTVSKVCSWTRDHNIKKLKDLAEHMIAENPYRDSGVFELHQDIEKIIQEGYKNNENTELEDRDEESEGNGFFDGLKPDRDTDRKTEQIEPELDEEEQEFEKELEEIEEEEFEEEFSQEFEEEGEEDPVDEVDDEDHENPEIGEEEAEEHPDDEDEWDEGGEGGFI